MRQFESLRITARMMTPVVADEWLPLDGILLYQATRRDLGALMRTIPGMSSLAEPKGEPMRGGSLPIKRVHGIDWYYRCSWAQPKLWWVAEGTDYWNKRVDMQYADMIDFGKRRGKVIIEAGRYKNYRMPIFYRVASSIEWYAIGDRKEIELLLSTCTHIGKKRSQGWGRVIEWVVESWPEDWSIWRDGKLTRGIPVYQVPERLRLNPVLYGVKPSYFDRRNQMPLIMP